MESMPSNFRIRRPCCLRENSIRASSRTPDRRIVTGCPGANTRSSSRIASTRSAPSRPWGFEMRAIRMKAASPVFIGVLLQDFQGKPLFELHSGRAENRPDRPRGSALLADNLTEVARGNPELEYRRLFAFNRSNRNFVRTVNQSFCDLLDELL